jgi:hypothetical protein
VLSRRGRRVYLLTNVLAPARLSRRMAGEIYQARWGVEVQFRSLKRILGHYRVLSKTPAAGAVERAASVLALALLMLEGAVALGRQVVRLSVAAALRAVREALEALRTGTWAAPLAGVIEASTWLRQIPRYRPTYERVVKKRGKKIARIVVARLFLRSLYKRLKDRVRFNPAPSGRVKTTTETTATASCSG